MEDKSLETPRRTRSVEVVVRRDSANVPSKSKTIETFLALAKALAWPLLCLFIFLYLREPISLVAKEVPDLASRMSKVSVGSFAVELRDQAKASGNPGFLPLIEGLSAQAIRKLLDTGTVGHRFMGVGERDLYFVPNAETTNALVELESKGLLEWVMPHVEFESLVKRLLMPVNLKSTGVDSVMMRPSRPLTPEEHDELLRQSYSLTAKGKKALDLIIAAVVNQLKAGERP